MARIDKKQFCSNERGIINLINFSYELARLALCYGCLILRNLATCVYCTKTFYFVTRTKYQYKRVNVKLVWSGLVWASFEPLS